MSKIIIAQHRAEPDIVREARRIRRILEEITPDIARDRARYGFEFRERHLQGTLNLPESTLRAGMSLCQGKIYGPADGWALPGAPAPDGSYALIRESGPFVEALSDAAASRSLWYYFDEDLFVVSNSQRAATLYAGRFALDPEAAPWILATGALGPGLSYNRHLRMLPPASSLLLDKARWSLQLTEGRIGFAPEGTGAFRTPAEARDAARAAITATLASFAPEEAGRMQIALSGGADSRLIASLLQREAPPGLRWQSFTGGPAEGAHLPETDVAVAAEVAARIGTRHRFIATHRSADPVETVIDRFVLASEGRVDHLGGYLDGLGLLRTLTADGLEVIIRGDTCFGGPPWQPAGSEQAMRATIGLLRPSEIAPLAGFALPDQAIPAALLRQPGESLLSWRDRLYLQYRAPSVLSALTEIKTAFTEVVNPLLSRRALAVASALPDPDRLDKALFREIIRDLVPDLPYAHHHGGLSPVEVLRRPGARRLLGASLASGTAHALFDASLLDWLRSEIDLVHLVRAKAVRTLARFAGRPPEAGLALHPLLIAFRIHMARLMVDRLQADAGLLGTAGLQERRSA